MLETIDLAAMICPVTKRSTASAGFTLIELIVTVAVVAVLAALAGPAFREYIAAQRIKNASFDLMAALSFARSEALKRNATVNLCATGTDWAGGWTVRIGPTNCSGTALRTQNALSGLVLSNSVDLTTLTYTNDGRPTASTKFTIALPAALSGVKSRCITIDLSGTPRSTVGACT
jgi:type IV fimbrial biogenesis protein FimT